MNRKNVVSRVVATGGLMVLGLMAGGCAAQGHQTTRVTPLNGVLGSGDLLPHPHMAVVAPSAAAPTPTPAASPENSPAPASGGSQPAGGGGGGDQPPAPTPTPVPVVMTELEVQVTAGGETFVNSGAVGTSYDETISIPAADISSLVVSAAAQWQYNTWWSVYRGFTGTCTGERWNEPQEFWYDWVNGMPWSTAFSASADGISCTGGGEASVSIDLQVQPGQH